MKEIQNRSIEFNHDVLDYDYEDDVLDDHIKISDKGVHLTPITLDFRTSIRFDEGEFVTSFTQVIQPLTVVSDWCGIGPVRYSIGGFSPQSGVSSMVLNAFAHDTGLEVGSFFNTSDP